MAKSRRHARAMEKAETETRHVSVCVWGLFIDVCTVFGNYLVTACLFV